MKHSEISQQAKFLWQVTSDVAMVQIDSGDGVYGRIGREIRTVDASIVAHDWTDPVGGEVVRVRQDSLPPRLERNVGVSEVSVGEGEGRRYGHSFPSVAVLVEVVQELAAADLTRLKIRQAIRREGGDGGGGEEEEEEEYEKE